MDIDDTGDKLYPIAVLIDELKHEDVTLRLNAIHRLPTIALALGAERAREELIPFLEESVDDEDEVLQALAEELGKFVEFVGGPTFAHVILPPLENLCAVEETVVRDKAVESMNAIVASFNTQQIEEFFAPAIRRLASGDWFTSRTSAAGLFASCYATAEPATQEELRRLYIQLSRDETPMVRRAAASKLKDIVRVVGKDQLLNDFLPVFYALSQDEQDSVRLLTVEAFVAIAERLEQEEIKHHLAQVLRNLCADRSWRVRYMVAEKFVMLSKVVGQEIITEDLIQALVHLLKDNEAECRTAASDQVPGFSELIDQDSIKKHILPCVKDLVTDTSQHVRAALATKISGLAPLLGKETTIDQLLPFFLQLLKDEFPDVRLNVISKLNIVNDVIGIDLLSQSLLPAIVELAEDKQWRVRLAIIEYIPLLAKQLGVEFFNEKLGALCMSWLGDSVFSIRDAAAVNLKNLVDVFGVDWGKTMIIPKVLESCQNSNYLQRMTAILAIGALAHAVTPEVITEQLLPAILVLMSDPIPNIRFNVAKVLLKLIEALQKGNQEVVVEDKIKPALVKLNEDVDNDVRYYAQQAMLIAQ